MSLINNRVLISVDGECPYHCKHCYTYDLPKQPHRSIEEIVESISNEKFDVVYVSQKIENFADPALGLELCESVFQRYKCHIVIITRNTFKGDNLNRLVSLKNEMKLAGKLLFLGISVIGMDSANCSERLDIIPNTIERLDFIKSAHLLGIKTLLLVRPMFPKELIPSFEIEQIIDYVNGNVSCVLTGPLMVTKFILQRLELNEHEIKYVVGGESEYLNGAIKDSMKFVNVLQEINHLKSYCLNRNIPFFEHSMPALNYLLNLN